MFTTIPLETLTTLLRRRFDLRQAGAGSGCCECTQSAWRPGGTACRPCQAAAWPGPSARWNVTGRRGRRSPSRGTTPLVHCGVPGLTVWSAWLATYHVCVIVPVRDGRDSVLQCFAQYRRLRESRLSPGWWTKLSHRHSIVSAYNALPSVVRNMTTSAFRKELKQHLLTKQQAGSARCGWACMRVFDMCETYV